jgi:hypothetical protein
MRINKKMYMHFLFYCQLWASEIRNQKASGAYFPPPYLTALNRNLSMAILLSNFQLRFIITTTSSNNRTEEAPTPRTTSNNLVLQPDLLGVPFNGQVRDLTNHCPTALRITIKLSCKCILFYFSHFITLQSLSFKNKKKV